MEKVYNLGARTDKRVAALATSQKKEVSAVDRREEVMAFFVFFINSTSHLSD